MPRLDERQLATVLAALRYWQQDLLADRDHDGEGPISDFFAEHEPLSADEIDTLCEYLNSGDDEVERPVGYVLWDHDARQLVGTAVYQDYGAAADAATALPDVLVVPFYVTSVSSHGDSVESNPPSDAGGPEPCDCEQPGLFFSGVPGIIARLEHGWLPIGVDVERCDACQRYPSDEAALAHLRELGMAPPPIDALPAYLL